MADTRIKICSRAGLMLAVAAALIAPAVAMGDEGLKILPDDGGFSQGFGWSVDTDGVTAIVGAVGDQTNGTNSGAAYLFDVQTGMQLHKLLPMDGHASALFGGAVAVDGEFAVVGSYQHNGEFENSGDVYVFDVQTGAFLFKLADPEPQPNAGFGGDVAIRDGMIAVTSWCGPFCVTKEGDPLYGSVEIYDALTGDHLRTILPDVVPRPPSFGTSVSLDAKYITASDLGDDENGFLSGAVYVFDRDTGQQLRKLLPDDGAPEDQFGRGIDLEDGLAVIGAEQDDDLGNNSGSGYVFDLATGQQLHKLLPTQGGASDKIGRSVGITGDIVVLSAGSDDDNGMSSGAIYLFHAVTGAQITKLIPSDNEDGDRFGDRVSGAGGVILADAGGDEDNGIGAGAAYLFRACIADLNLDGSVDTADLGQVILSIGSDDPVADLNGDGVVDTADLGILINQFGFSCL